MNKNTLEYAVKLLHDEKFCCVTIIDDELHTSNDLGIKPLMTFLRKDKAAFKGGIVADKVIGKAAALMLALGGAVEVYGEVMSQSAKMTLEEFKIKYSFGQLVPYIKNRTDTGMCPMEETVLEISNPELAFFELEKTIARLMNKG